MVCKTCKTEFQGSFCPQCGASTVDGTDLNQFKQILFDQSENVVAVLGNSTAQTFISTGILGNGFAILSNKRIYFKGKCLIRQGRGVYRKTEEKSVDINDITGTGFVHNSAFWAKVLFIFFCILSSVFFATSIIVLIEQLFLAMIRGTFSYIDFSYFNYIGNQMLWGIICGSLCLLFKFLYKRYDYSAFEISYAGGSIAFDMHWITEDESKKFQREINLLKDKLKTEKIVPESKLDQTEQLLKYNDLLKKGVITQEEFDAKKKQLLDL